MKILLTNPGSELYGSDRMAMEAAEGLVRRGHSVVAVLPETGPLATKLVASGVAVGYVSVPVLRKSAMSVVGVLGLAARSVAGLVRALRILRHERPDVVYVNTLTQPVWMVAARLSRTGLVVHVREIEADAPRCVQRALVGPLRLASVVLCNSHATRGFVVAASPRLAGVSTVVYNGKDWSTYRVRRSELTHVPLLLTVGRVSPKKGQDVVIDALVELDARGVQARYRIVGDVFPGYEWYADTLRHAVHEHRLEDRVDFVGVSDDVASEYVRATIVVVPSRSESLGTVVLEAMAAGCVVVASDVEGPAEIIEDRHTGYLFEMDNPTRLADVVQHVLANPSEVSGIVLRSQTMLDERFSAEAYANGVEAALSRASHANGRD